MILESGNNYKICQIFCGDNNKIMIPDLQRDYCWGNPENNLVKGFVDGLLEMNHNQSITMGLIYGYYNKYMPEHLQLCDGQQRLTTLFIIIGVLNRKLGFMKYANLLMSSFEFNCDDQEPYLQYAIRESSLYFLSDLTVNYFLKKGLETVEDISKQPWFLNEYCVDPTVNSIINAIETIECCLENKSDEELASLGDFISTKLDFLFYDMGNRENGEETFVIINTTGEPLSATQNLKPLIIEANHAIVPEVAKLWEEMETWFWRNRRHETEYPHTSDEGMDCFLNLVRLLHCDTEEESYGTIENTDKFPHKEISFTEIYDDFLVYSRLYEMDFSERFDKSIRYPSKQKFYQQDRIYAILPTIRYCLRFRNADDENIKRIYHLFSNMARYRDTNRYKDNRTGKQYSPIFRATEMVEMMSDADCLSLMTILADRIENVEEPIKLKFISLYKDSPDERKKVEILLSEAENHDVFNGQVGNVIEWCNMDKEMFAHYYYIFATRWNVGDFEKMDILRRALLTRNMEDYPIRLSQHFYNFGNKDTWLNIIKLNSKEIGIFLDDARSLQSMIDDFEDTNSKWYIFVKKPSLMQFSEYKNAYIYDQVVVDMKKERTSSDYKITYQDTAYSKNILASNAGKWSWIWANENCIWSDNNIYNLTLDYFMRPDGYQIVLWKGKHPNLKTYPYYEQIGALGLTKIDTGDWAGRWITPLITDANTAKNAYREIAKRIDEDKPLIPIEQ